MDHLFHWPDAMHTFTLACVLCLAQAVDQQPWFRVWLGGRCAPQEVSQWDVNQGCQLQNVVFPVFP